MNRILLVDDDDEFRCMLRLTLVKLGHEVVEARNGDDALRLQGKAKADVLLTDLIMPEREGLETIQAFQRLHPRVKIVAMSGHGGSIGNTFLGIAKAFGATHTLTKPFSDQELSEALALAISAPAPTRSDRGTRAPATPASSSEENKKCTAIANTCAAQFRPLD